MVAKQLHLEDGKTGLIKGIDKLAAAVGSTLGPSGRTVVLQDDFGNPHITKDGVTVAKDLNLPITIEDLGVRLVRQAAEKTASKAGDGTTTSTVLAHSIIHNCGDKDSVYVKRDMQRLADDICAELDEKSVPVTPENQKEVAIISTNGDEELGGLISEAFTVAGENGIVVAETSEDERTYIEHKDGTHLDSITRSQHFHTNKEKEICELDKPFVLLSKTPIANLMQIEKHLEFAIKGNKPVLIVAEVEAQPMAALAMNKLKGNIKVNVIDPPSFGDKRLDLLEDLAFLTGGRVINEDLGDSLGVFDAEDLGYAEKSISSADGTTLVISEPEGTEERVKEIKDSLETTKNAVLKRHLAHRLSLLSGGVAVLKVGAHTEIELKEKKDRVDDALHAVRAAKKEGILPGGGSALKFLSQGLDDLKSDGRRILIDSLSAPFNRILSNAGLDTQELQEWGKGVDARTGKVVDMIKKGIIDPTMVTKQALQNAVSVASAVISTDAVISNVIDRS